MVKTCRMTSKGGVTVAFTIAASGKALVRLTDLSSTKRRKSFAVRVSTAAGENPIPD